MKIPRTVSPGSGSFAFTRPAKISKVFQVSVTCYVLTPRSLPQCVVISIILWMEGKWMEGKWMEGRLLRCARRIPSTRATPLLSSPCPSSYVVVEYFVRDSSGRRADLSIIDTHTHTHTHGAPVDAVWTFPPDHKTIKFLKFLVLYVVRVPTVPFPSQDIRALESYGRYTIETTPVTPTHKSRHLSHPSRHDVLSSHLVE